MTGILLAEAVKHEHTSHLSLRHYVFWSLIMVSGIVITYTGISYLGLDPLWSLSLAKKWCANSDWVHPDTTPFFAFVRDISSLIGKYGTQNKLFCYCFLWYKALFCTSSSIQQDVFYMHIHCLWHLFTVKSDFLKINVFDWEH